MSRMWEYITVDFPINEFLQGEGFLTRDEVLNSMGAEGWELIDSRYVHMGVGGEAEEGMELMGTFWETFKREITSGITPEQRKAELAEINRANMEQRKNEASVPKKPDSEMGFKIGD